MHKHELRFMRLTANRLLTPLAIISLALTPSCGAKNASDSANADAVSTSMGDYYHADNDIAMTVRSIADAIKVGEPLDSTDYDFKGVLTDGQGTPLYTDVQGSPGLWIVDILDTKNASIKNLYLGDLLPGDLQSYLLQSLHLSEEQQIDFIAHDAIDDETEITVYDFDGGYLRFEIRAGIAPNGLEGPLLTIFMSAEPPAVIMPADSQTKDEKQKEALAQNGAKP